MPIKYSEFNIFTNEAFRGRVYNGREVVVKVTKGEMVRVVPVVRSGGIRLSKKSIPFRCMYTTTVKFIVSDLGILSAEVQR